MEKIAIPLFRAPEVWFRQHLGNQIAPAGVHVGLLAA
jgi:hypothetical protein